MKKKYIILGGLFLALTMLFATTLTATATLNGPFSITPDRQASCGEFKDEGPPAMATCNADRYGHGVCCNWAQGQVGACEDDEGNNCFTVDKYRGECCYP